MGLARLTASLGQVAHCFREQVDLLPQQEEGDAGAHAIVGDGERADDDRLRLLQMRSRGGRKSLRPALAQGPGQLLAVPVGYGKGDEGCGTLDFKRGVERDAGDGAQGLFEATGELHGAFPDSLQPDIRQVAGGKCPGLHQRPGPGAVFEPLWQDGAGFQEKIVDLLGV